MTTIPMSQIVSVLPGVEGAAGQGLVMNGLMLSSSWRVPNGSVLLGLALCVWFVWDCRR